jgi:heat shock protein HslJ
MVRLSRVDQYESTEGVKMKIDNHSNPRLLIRLAGLSVAIVLALAACAPAATPTPANSIQGIVWQWTSVTDQSTKATTTVPNPANYTIIFNSDGTLTGKADCNSFTGTYSQQNGFTIKLGASTMAFCGENSLDQQYLKLLGSVAAGGPDGAGGLALETAGGAQRMMFKNGGAAPK